MEVAHSRSLSSSDLKAWVLGVTHSIRLVEGGNEPAVAEVLQGAKVLVLASDDDFNLAGASTVSFAQARWRMVSLEHDGYLALFVSRLL